jgi:SSS family transporter
MLATALAIYLAVQLGIGYFASRFVRSETDFLLAGRSLGLGLASMSLFATWFGAETVMGTSAAIAGGGIADSRADPFGYTLCLLLMGFLLARKMREAGYVTIGDFFRDHFGVPAEKLACLLTLVTSLLWAAAQLLAFSLIIGTVLPISHPQALLFATIFVTIYTTMGGLLADVYTDFLQGIIVALGLIALACGLIGDAGGIAAAWHSIEAPRLSFIAPTETLWPWLDSWAVPVLGSLIAQESLSRVLACKTPSTAVHAAYSAGGIYLFVGMMPVIIGLLGPVVVPTLADFDDNYVLHLAESELSPLLYVVFAGAILSAILSTIDSTLLALSALVEHNLLREYTQKASGKQKLWLARCCSVLSGLAAWMLASGTTRIYDLLSQASSFGSAGILVIFLLRIYWGKGTNLGAILTLLTGATMSWLGESYFHWQAPYLASISACVWVYILCALAQKSRRVPA